MWQDRSIEDAGMICRNKDVRHIMLNEVMCILPWNHRASPSWASSSPHLAVQPFKLCNVKLAFASIIVHVADFPKDRPLGPTHIMYSTNGPHATWTEKTSCAWVQTILIHIGYVYMNEDWHDILSWKKCKVYSVFSDLPTYPLGSHPSKE